MPKQTHRVLLLLLLLTALTPVSGCLADRLADEVAEQLVERKANKEESTKPARPPKPVDDGPLRLMRAAPTGDVETVSEIRLSFTQPILGASDPRVTADKPAAILNPATIEPAIDGAWRWVDVRTVVFEPSAGRVPMATDFRVTLNPTLKSAAGKVLEQTGAWNFSTAALKVQAAYPAGMEHTVKPLIFLNFNQPIERAAIIEYIHVSARSERVELELLSDSEVNENETLAKLAANAAANHWIAMRPTQNLPASSNIVIMLAEGAPSLEGPKLSAQEVVSKFRTHDPLAVTEHACASERQCSRTLDWFIRFNHELDAEDFSPTKVRITPEIEDIQISLKDRTISINGRAKSRTDYTVTLDASLKDRFGQTLGEDTEFKFGVDGVAPFFGGPERSLRVLDPELKGHFPVYSTNYKRLRVMVHRVTPNDWQAYTKYREGQFRYKEGEQLSKPPGKKVIDRTIRIQSKPDTMARTLIDLRSALNRQGHGQLIVTIGLPRDEIKEAGLYPVYSTWVQATGIALHGRTHRNDLLVWTSGLRDGKPLGDVRISLLKSGFIAGRTSPEGLRILPLPKEGYSPATGRRTGDLLVAIKGQDVAILPQIIPESPKDRSGWLRYRVNSQILWHAMEDWALYQSGTTATVRGWIRPIMPIDTDQIPPMTVQKISYTASNAARRGKIFATGQAELDAKGHFGFDVDLGDSTQMRKARVKLRAHSGRHNDSIWHEIQILPDDQTLQPFIGQ